MLDSHAGVSERAGYVVVALHGELDTLSAADAARMLMAAAAPQLRIIVDLAEVTFMDCRSAHELISARAQVRQAGGDLLLAAPQPRVLRLLSLLDLIDLLPVVSSAEEAINGARS
jgi:anti-sigma B factor antagonist